MNATNRYRNPWHSKLNVPKAPFYENNAPCVLEHRGVKVFKLREKAYDYVLGDCCIAQRGGAGVEAIDGLLDGRANCCEEVATHIRANGHTPTTYSEYMAAYNRGEVE